MCGLSLSFGTMLVIFVLHAPDVPYLFILTFGFDVSLDLFTFSNKNNKSVGNTDGCILHRLGADGYGVNTILAVCDNHYTRCRSISGVRDREARGIGYSKSQFVSLAI